MERRAPLKLSGRDRLPVDTPLKFYKQKRAIRKKNGRARVRRPTVCSLISGTERIVVSVQHRSRIGTRFGFNSRIAEKVLFTPAPRTRRMQRQTANSFPGDCSPPRQSLFYSRTQPSLFTNTAIAAPAQIRPKNSNSVILRRRVGALRQGRRTCGRECTREG